MVDFAFCAVDFNLVRPVSGASVTIFDAADFFADDAFDWPVGMVAVFAVGFVARGARFTAGFFGVSISVAMGRSLSSIY